MTDKNSSNAFEQFLTTAKSLSDYDQTAELIKRVVESPAIYSFNEFLEIPFIASVFINFFENVY